MSWMAWTLPTALFFYAVALALLIMTIWGVVSPSPLRRGWLPFATTRGDRFFMTLLTAAFVHIVWLATTDASILFAGAISIALGLVLLRWG